MNIAVITGASSGMGLQFALKLNSLDKDIDEFWLIARRKKRLEILSRKLGSKTRIFALDLEKTASIEELQKDLKNNNPKIKYLVNAAGFGIIGDVGEYDMRIEAEMLDLNVRGVTLLTNICLKYMSEGSSIFMLASAAAFMPQPGFAVYAASKAYVLSYSRALSNELKKRKINVIAVCPGPVSTEFFKKAEKKHSMAFYKKIFMADARAVVSRAISDSLLRRSVSVYGFGMNIFRFFTKLMPHGFLMKIIKLK